MSAIGIIDRWSQRLTRVFRGLADRWARRHSVHVPEQKRSVEGDGHRSSAMRIALFGNFGTSNLGNEASLRAFLEFVRAARPDADILCICNGPENVEREHHVAAVPIKAARPVRTWLRVLDRLTLSIPWLAWDFTRSLVMLRSIDAVFVPGTGILDDLGERWQDMPYNIYKWSLASTLYRRPFAIVSAGAGPITRRINRRLMGAAAKRASYLSFRDQRSLDFCRELGVDNPHATTSPDLVFGLPTPPRADTGERSDSRLVVGVGIMSYWGWNLSPAESARINQRYLTAMTEFVVWLLRNGYGVRLLVGATYDDTAIAHVKNHVESLHEFSPSPLFVSEIASSIDEVMVQMLETDIVVATRFHNLVAALALGLPVVSVSYAAKGDDLLGEFGLSEFCQHTDEVDVERLIDQFRRLIERKDDATAVIRETLTRMRASLDSAEASIRAELL